jgi:hypothetical protein
VQALVSCSRLLRVGAFGHVHYMFQGTCAIYRHVQQNTWSGSFFKSPDFSGHRFRGELPLIGGRLYANRPCWWPGARERGPHRFIWLDELIRATGGRAIACANCAKDSTFRPPAPTPLRQLHAPTPEVVRALVAEFWHARSAPL